MKKTKGIDGKKIIWIVWFLVLIIAVYFLMPYVLHILGIPSLVVMSESMTHQKEDQAFFESYWQSRGINPKELPYRHGINPGDLVFLSNKNDYKVGDVITFTTTQRQITTTHRLYYYNGTHFRDIWDVCLYENNSRKVLLAIEGIRIIEATMPEGQAEANLTYEGPRFEMCSYNWLPFDNIKGKVVFVLPMAGLLHERLNPLSTQRS